ncbi:MAG: DMT family transporter [Granulosicoccus sp.]|nr:DMT family transporter [Granulosicoccus sp.]
MTALVRRAFLGTVGNAYLLLIIAPLMWGGNSVAGRLATEDWQPFTVTSLRWLLTCVFLLPFAIGPLRRDWPLLRQNLWLMFSLGAGGMAMFNLLMYWSLNYTTAINVSIEQASMPVFIMLANFIILSQRVRWMQIVGLLLTLFGVLVTATAGEPARFFTEGLNRGDAIMLFGCLFYAAYTFGLRWRPAIHWMSFMWMIALSAFIMTIPFASWELSQGEFTMPGIKGWLVLLYVLIFPTVISQLAYARGVELLGSNRAGLFVNLVPIFGSLLAVLILGERFHWYHLAGLLLVLAGIALAERAAGRQR